MGEVSGSRKRKSPDEQNYDCAEILSFSDEFLFAGDEDVGGGELEIEEEMVIAVMKKLEEEISSPPSCSVSSWAPIGGEIDETSSPTSATRLLSPGRSIGGKIEEIDSPLSQLSSVTLFLSPTGSSGGRSEESCGSSFSDSASTVMASVDEGTSAMAAGTVACLVGVGKDWGPAAEVWPWAVETSESVEGETPDEDDDEWLERVLGGPLMEWEWEWEECCFV